MSRYVTECGVTCVRVCVQSSLVGVSLSVNCHLGPVGGGNKVIACLVRSFISLVCIW